MRTWRGGFALVAAAAALCCSAVPAAAATSVFPGGGGAFAADLEGWEVTGASCNAPALCSVAAGYDGTDGAPAGSLEVDTNVSLNLLALFSSTAAVQSPDFTVGSSGVAALHLDRRFSSGSLVDLAPKLEYSAQLVDRTSGRRSTAISGTLTEDSGWLGDDGAATVAAGHTYAIVLRAVTSSTVAATGLLSGTAGAGFDNVALSVQASRGRGGHGGEGADQGGAGGEISARRLEALAPSTVAGPATVKGTRVFVRARCPKRIGRACRIALVGLLRKHRPATAGRAVKVPKGGAKRIALRLKPRATGRLSRKRRLLFRVRLRAGRAHATAYRRLKLIRG